MKKILIITNSAMGLWEFRKELLQRLVANNQVYIALPENSGQNYINSINETGSDISFIHLERRGTNPIKDLGLFTTLVKLIREINPDYVCTYTIKPNIYGGLAAVINHKKLIINITGLGTVLEKKGLLGSVLIRMLKLPCNKAVKVFFQNIGNMEYLKQKGIGRKNGELLPGSGVNLDFFSYSEMVKPTTAKELKVLAVMRIMKDKGIGEYLDLAESYGKKYDFLLAGPYEEDERKLWENRIEKLTAEKKLNFLGYRDDMRQLYRGCHILIHPSYHEGLSNVCLEAAAIGRAIITTDVPGCRETVNKNSGFLVPPGDSKALSKAFCETVNMDFDEIKMMGLAGRHHVEEKFSRELVIEKYLNAMEIE